MESRAGLGTRDRMLKSSDMLGHNRQTTQIAFGAIRIGHEINEIVRATDRKAAGSSHCCFAANGPLRGGENIEKAGKRSRIEYNPRCFRDNKTPR